MPARARLPLLLLLLLPAALSPVGAADTHGFLARIYTNTAGATLPYRLLPLYLEEEGAPGGPVRWLPRPDPDLQLSEGPHLFYSIQWFAFAVALPFGYLLLYHNRTRPAARFAE